MKTILLAVALLTGLSTSMLAAAAPASAQVSGGIYVQLGPPAPIVEYPPIAPGPGYLWQPGYWQWNGYRYVWFRGRYVRAPYRGAGWIPGHWDHRGRGWVWVPGHWR